MVKPAFLVAICLALLGCSGIAFNTTVADQPANRIAMLQSVEIGRTTEREFVTRWGNPTQKMREGGQTEFIYRNIIDPGSTAPIQYGRSDAFVIVTFQYGVAVDFRSSETELCRATFPPRPPGHGFNTPTTVRPLSTCPDTTGAVTTGNYGLAPGAPLPPHVRKRLQSSGRLKAGETAYLGADGRAYAEDGTALGEETWARPGVAADVYGAGGKGSR